MFYGESYRVSEAINLAGSAVGDGGAALQYLYRDEDTTTLMAGDSVLVAIEPSWSEATADDPAVISWVLESASSSSGTLELTAGADFTYSADPAATTEPLGAHVIAGASTLVVKQTAITFADLIDYNAQAVLRITCSAGTVTLRQARLRAWPPGGPSGAWAPGASYPTTAGAGRFTATIATPELPTQSSPQEAAAAARAVIPDPGSVVWTLKTSTTAQAQSLAQVGSTPTIPPRYDASLVRTVQYLSCEPRVIDTTLSGTPGVHPDVVSDDWTSQVRAVGGGPLLTEFESWTAPAQIISNTPTGVVAVEGREVPLEYVGTDGSGQLTYSGPWASPSGWAPVVDGDSLPLPDVPQLVISTASATWFTDPAGTVAEDVRVGTIGISANELVPDHEWWDPALPWVPDLEPRFFVKHQDDSMRPVGFGKPASELTVFRVPGGGRWRDLTTDEYATYGPTVRPPGGVALKVKRLDASGSPWWDHVAWMVPDA